MILVTGATGYVGGRLVRSFEAAGRAVRCLARRPEHLRSRLAATTEVVAGDVLDPASLARAMQGVTAAYYLVHSMGSAGSFEEEDRRAAANFGAAARAAGVRRIVYLGALAHGSGLSPHLESRLEVGRILAASGVPTLEFRAAIVLGSGSLSFELIRALVEKLPVMVTPRWVAAKTQPIAVEDLLSYLALAADLPLAQSRVFEIGGADEVSYGDLMREYARQRDLKRWMVPVPFLSPRLSSLWLGLVTPVYARVGRILIDSLRHDTVVRDAAALRAFPIVPRGYREAIERALRNEDREMAATRWSDALSVGGGIRTWTGVEFGTRVVDSRVVHVNASPEEAFAPIRRIGGRTGWYFGSWLWRVRGFLDLLVGGPGLRRGRRDPEHLVVGDTVDFWRVEAVEPDRLLRLQAEMHLPGRAWLQFEVQPDPAGGSSVRQTAMFDPRGLGGRLYWAALFPMHGLIFGGMLKRIARVAETRTAP